MVNMALIPYQGVYPTLNPKSYIAEGAYVIGQVTMEEFSSIWYGCVVRGDVNKIVIGKYTNIQDGAIIHNEDSLPAILGDYVTIGHGAIVHGCTVEDHCLIGMHATVLNGAHIGRGSIIAAGAVVKEHAKIPPFSLVAGVPGKIIRTNPEATLEKLHRQAVKYKTLWSKWYGFMPNVGGEVYTGGKII
jgi:carbonic anhydrase/acetyltransferase-like protein (isoleucine patch superfamily)